MKQPKWGIAQGDTLAEVGDMIVDQMLGDPNDMQGYEKSHAITEVRTRMYQAGASYEETKTVVEHVRGRLGK